MSSPENPQNDAPQYDADQYDTDPRHADPYAPGDPDTEPGGPPYRAIAMVLLAAVVLAVGVGLVQLFGSDDDATPTATDETTSQVEQSEQNAAGESAPGQAGQPGQDGQPGGPEASAPGAPGSSEGRNGQPGDSDAPGEQSAGSIPGEVVPGTTSVPVQIYNNSNVTGLAARTGESLRENGFAVGDVANMPSNRGVVAESTAFYGTGPGEQQAAEAVAAQLGISAKPRPADMAGDAPGVIVIVTQDLDR